MGAKFNSFKGDINVVVDTVIKSTITKMSHTEIYPSSAMRQIIVGFVDDSTIGLPATCSDTVGASMTRYDMTS